MSVVSIEELRRLLSYDPETGILTWRVTLNNRVKAGSEAGSINRRGYRKIMIRRRQYQSHRLAFALHYGESPAGEIDHRNGAVADNRISNLRDVSHAENMRNQKLYATNVSGRVGVHFDKATGKWMAQIRVGGRLVHIGRFQDFTDACVAREAAEPKYGFDANHGRAAS